MVKITTRQQFELLIQEMENNPHIARGVRGFGDTKECIVEAWKEISQKLNSCGPPTRSAEEWQRVWIHFKAKLKKKIAQNKKNLKATGGGPSQEVSLSQLEKVAADLLHMELSVNPQGSCFGVNTAENLQELLENVQQGTELLKQPELLKENEAELTTEPEEQIGPEKKQRQNENKRKHTDENLQQPQKKRIRLEDKRFSLLQEQTGTQSELVSTLKKIEKSLYKRNEILKQAKDLKRKKYEVLKEIKDIKRRKFDLVLEEQLLNRKIKEKKT